jgi:putative aldouronate transport system substrate-binding protein
LFNLKKTVLLVIVGLLVVSLVSAIGFGATTTKKPVSLSLCVPSLSAATDPGLMDEVKKYTEQQTNTNIKLIFIPMNAYADKFPVLLASGDIPDVYRITKAMVNVNSYTAKGYTADITRYVNRIPGFKDIPQFSYLTINKKIRAVPMQKEQQKVIWVRKDITDKYGVKLSSTPTTEEFFNEMKKVKDVVPLSFPKFLDNLPFFYRSFGGYDEFIKNKKGKYYDAFSSNETKEALKYINRLYAAGILDKEFPTTENTALRNNLIAGKCAANVDYDSRYFYYLTQIAQVAPDAKPELQPLFRLTGPTGLGGTHNEALSDAMGVSPKSTHPQAAVALIHWMYFTPEGERAIRIGLPGKHYTVENGVPKVTPQAQAGGMSLDLTQILNQFVDYDKMGFGFKFPGEEAYPAYANLMKDENKYVGIKPVVPLGASPTYDKVGPSLIAKRQELALKMIMGTSSIDDGYKEYAKYFQSINGDQMIAELNQRF